MTDPNPPSRLPIALHPWEVAETVLPAAWTHEPGTRLMVVVDGGRRIRQGGAVRRPEDRAHVLAAAIRSPAGGLAPARPARVRHADPALGAALAEFAEGLAVRLEHVDEVHHAEAALHETLRRLATTEAGAAPVLPTGMPRASHPGSAPLVAGACSVSVGVNAEGEHVVVLRLATREARRLAQHLVAIDATSLARAAGGADLLAWADGHLIGTIAEVSDLAELHPERLHLWVIGGGARRRSFTGDELIFRRELPVMDA